MTTLRNEPTARPRTPARTTRSASTGGTLADGSVRGLQLTRGLSSPSSVGPLWEVGRRRVLQPGVVPVVLEVAGAAGTTCPDDAAPLLGDRPADTELAELGAVLVVVHPEAVLQRLDRGIDGPGIGARG